MDEGRFASTASADGGGDPFEGLASAIDQAFCVIEIVHDIAGAPIDYRFLETNHVFELQTGLVNAVGRTMRSMVPDHEAHWFTIYGEIARTGVAQRFVNEARKLNRVYEVYAFPLGGDKVGVLFSDIAARQAGQAAVQARDEHLQLALNAAQMGAWTYDVQTGATHQSARYHALFGRDASDIAPNIEDVYERIHPDDRDRVRESIARALRGEQPYRTEYRVQRPDGHTVWIHSEGAVSRNAAGEAVRVHGVIYDVTERREAEDLLHDADRRKNEFLAVLAHELRNPLAPLRNSLEIMKRVLHDPEMLARLHGTMDRQVGQMIRLVDDLLDVSGISHGRITLNCVRVDLTPVLLSAVETSRPAIEAGRHHVHVTLPPSPLWVSGDAARLGQVFLNLLNNGAKYTAPGGDVWLTADRAGDTIVVTVRDNGIGLTPESLGTIFDMFTQVDASAGRTQGGLGIGLTLVRRLVELHHGTVTARSDGLGAGSEFEVRLPAVD